MFIVARKHRLIVAVTLHYPSAYVFDVVTEGDIVQLAALQYRIDEGDVLCGIVAADMHPDSTTHRYVTEHPLGSYVVHLYMTVIQETTERDFIIQYVIDRLHHCTSIFMGVQPVFSE